MAKSVWGSTLSERTISVLTVILFAAMHAECSTTHILHGYDSALLLLTKRQVGMDEPPSCTASKMCTPSVWSEEFRSRLSDEFEQRGDRRLDSLESFGNPRCSCHRFCHLYSLCCEDRAPIPSTSVDPTIGVLPTPRGTSPKNRYTTRVLADPRTVSCHLGHVMVTSCPVSSGVDGPSPLRELCAAASTQLSEGTGMYNTPVTSNTSGITYSNVYCGLCNKVPFTELVRWTHSYRCITTTEEAPFESISRSARQGAPTTPKPKVTCTLNLPKPVDPETAVTCSGIPFFDATFLWYCPPESDPGVSRLCSYGPALYMKKESITYKNRHCAECHGVTDAQCNPIRIRPLPPAVLPPIRPPLGQKPTGPDRPVYKPNGGGQEGDREEGDFPAIVIPVARISRLVQEVHVDEVGRCFSQSTPLPCPTDIPKRRYCSADGEKYDERTQLCVSICPEGYRFENFDCKKSVLECIPIGNTTVLGEYSISSVLYSDNYIQIPHNTTNNLCFSCSLVEVAADDIVYLHNSSFIANTIDGIQGIAYHNGTTTYICTEAYQNLNNSRIIVNESEQYISYRFHGRHVLLERSQLLVRNLSSVAYFLKKTNNKTLNSICDFIKIPKPAIINFTATSVTIRENLRASQYSYPFYVHDSETNETEVCFTIPATLGEDECDYELTNSSTVYNNPTGDSLIFVEDSSERSQLFRGEYLRGTANTGYFICRRKPLSWLDRYEGIIGIITYTLSLGGLLILLFIYVFVRALHNLPSTVMIHTSVAFFLAILLYTLTAVARVDAAICVGVAIATHYFMMAAFVFTIVYAVCLARGLTVVQPSNRAICSRQSFSYCFAGWAIPMAIIACFVTLHFTAPHIGPKYGEPLCFINSRTSLTYYFHVPIAVMVTVNTLILAYIIAKVLHSGISVGKAKKGVYKKHAILALTIAAKLEVSFGLLWCFALLAMFSQNNVTVYIFTVVNGLQGFFLFLVFVCNPRVIRRLKESRTTTVSTFSPKKTQSTSIDHSTSNV